MKFEICLESVDSVAAAQLGGAHRVELCCDLFEGGLTPSLGTFRVARKENSIAINVMIRPRGGDFCYSDKEFEVMCEDARIFREEGADGLVFGALHPNATIDEEKTSQLIEIAKGLPVTFHRAFDMTKDLTSSLETLIQLGCTRVLTSGGEATVMDGFCALQELVRQAKDRIIIMPGCGITERNFAFLHDHINASEYHIFLPKEYSSMMEWRPSHVYMGGLLRQPEFSITHTDTQRVAFFTSKR